MTSLREQILVRLEAIIGEVDGIVTAGRNVLRVDDLVLPAAILHDGDEEAKADPQVVGKRPNAITMNPVIQLRFSGSAAEIGPAASAWLAKVQKTILADVTLETLCRGVRPHGPRYVGAGFLIAEGRGLIGQLSVHFAISCGFDPNQL